MLPKFVSRSKTERGKEANYFSVYINIEESLMEMYTAYLPFFHFFQHFDVKKPDLITRSTPQLDVSSFVEISTLEMRTSNASKLALIRVMGGFSRVSFRPS